jgi:transcriptional regulator with XRE-family HTH domain
MEEPGQKLKRVRERLGLRFRDVEEASQQIAVFRQSDEYVIALSRLSDIENKGTLPSIYRLYTLCTIYRLDLEEVLSWYGVELSAMTADAARISLERTHLISFSSAQGGEVQFPLTLDPGIDVKRTHYLSRMIQKWGKLPLMLLSGMELKNRRYAFIGTEDWFMYPLLPPGSLVIVDEEKRRVQNTGWTNEFERPIYLLESRDGFLCGWCTLSENQLVVQPHPSSMLSPLVFVYSEEIDVIGQVTAVAMSLDPGRRRRTRS